MVDKNKYVDDLITAGATDNEILEALQMATSRGDFNSDTSPPVQPPQPPVSQSAPEQEQPKQGYLQGLGEYWTKDIPEAVKGVGERYNDRVKREQEPTAFGDLALRATGAKGMLGKNIEAVAGAPERLGRTLGTFGGTIGDVTGAAIGLTGKAINRWTGGAAGKALKPIAEDIGNAIGENEIVQNVAGWYDGLSPAEKANYGSALDMTELLGYKGGKLATRGAANTANLIGDVTEGSGKKLLRGGMKIKDVTAKLAGSNVDKGVEQIVDDIVKFNLTSKTGGFKGIANKAQNAIDSRKSYVSNALVKFKNKNPNATIDVDNILGDLATDIKNGKIAEIFTNEDNVATFVGEIQKSLQLRGLAGTQHVSKIPEINEAMRKGLDLFSKGKYSIKDAPIKEIVGDNAYLRMLDNVEQYMPDVRSANKEVHNLINVKKAALEATKRAGNKNAIGLTDALALLGGGPMLQSMGVSPGMSTIGPTLAAGLIAKKAAGNGRGASLLIDAGKNIKSIGDVVKKGETIGGVAGLGAPSIIENDYKKRKKGAK